MASATAARDRHAYRPWHRWVAYAVVLVAAFLRFRDLSSQSLWLDELWSLEAANGHGSEHESIPVNRVITAPVDLTHPAAARSLWHVWTGLDQITHPPASYLLLRGWSTCSARQRRPCAPCRPPAGRSPWPCCSSPSDLGPGPKRHYGPRV